MTCSEFQQRWAGRPAGQPPTLDAPMGEHARECAACAALAEGYQATVARFGAGTEEVGALPPFMRIRGGVRERRRQVDARRRLFTGLAWGIPTALAAAALLLVVPSLLPSEDGVRVVAAEGLSGYATEGTQWSAVELNDELAVGGVLETGRDGGVTLAEAGVAQVEVAARSRVTLAAWSNHEVSLVLDSGSLTSSVEPRTPDETFEIRTPLAVVRVVGTQFVTEHDANGTVVRGFEGLVRVTDLRGRHLGDVGAGEVLRVPPPSVAKGPVAKAEPEPEPVAAVVEPVAEPSRKVASGSKPSVAEPEPEPVTVKPEPKPAEVEVVEAPKRVKHGVEPRPKRHERVTAPKRVVKVEEPAPKAVVAEPAPEPAPAPAPAAPKIEAPEPPSVGELVRKAGRLLAAGKDSEAIELLEAAARRGRDYRVSRALGDAYRVAKRYQDAAASYRQALGAAGGRDAGPVVADLGDVLAKRLGRGGEAQQLWVAYLSEHPKGRAGAEVRWKLAQQVAKGQPQRAAGLWQEILDQTPGSLYARRALERLGRALLERNDTAAASKLFERFVDGKSRGLRETALVGLMHVRRRQGQQEKVKALAKRYHREFPNGRRKAEVARLVGQ